MSAPTRTPTTENFPVASVLLSPAARPKVLAFYRFVRAADDVADDPHLPAAGKLARLDAMEAALDDPATAMPEAVGMHAHAVGTEEARRMLSAFRQDSTRARYDDWAALQDYCARSAAPVGRMLLRLYGTDSAEAFAASDGLCEALQVLNHLQDLVPDRAAMDRVYLPVPWMALAGGEAWFFKGSEDYPLPTDGPATPDGRTPGSEAAGSAIGGPAAPDGVRRPPNTRREVLDAALDRVEEALDRASALPRLVASRRLALEAAVTLNCARILLARLRAADPVLGRVALTRADFAAALFAAPRAVSRTAPSGTDAGVVRAHVARAGSSFARGMAALRGERRRALWAVYAFCRAVDDVADNAMPDAEKRRFLAEWRGKLDRPDCALSRELLWARERFRLPRAECEAMIAGMETDAAPRVRLADEDALDLYCRRVAGSVGAMSVRIFGAHGAHGAEGGAAEHFGLRLGRTMQLVNILRDVDEDAERDRVYVPVSLLGGDGARPATALLAAPELPRVLDALAARARDGFRQAEREIAGFDARAMRPAAVMMWGYGRLLERMVARGFADRRERPRLTRAEKARMAWLALGGGRPPAAAAALSDEARAA